MSLAVLKAVACKSIQQEEYCELIILPEKKGRGSFYSLVDRDFCTLIYFRSSASSLLLHLLTCIYYSPLLVPNPHLLFSFPAMGKEKSSRIPGWCLFSQHLLGFVSKALVEGPLADGHQVPLLWFCALLLWGLFFESRRYRLREPS